MNDVTTGLHPGAQPAHADHPPTHAPPMHTPDHPPMHAGVSPPTPPPKHNGRDKMDWSHEVWNRIDAAVTHEIRRARVAAKFLRTVHVPPKTMTVPADVVTVPAAGAVGDAPQGTLYVDETATTKILEVWVEFSLTQAQVDDEMAAAHSTDHHLNGPQNQHHPDHGHHLAHNQHGLHGHEQHQHQASTGITLATNAANILAQVEDMIIFQGQNAFGSALISGANTTVSYRQIPTDLGLLNLQLPCNTTPPPLGWLPSSQIVSISPTIPASATNPTPFYQENTVSAVAKAFSILQSAGEYGPYVLVLQTTPFGDAYSPLKTTLITPAEPMLKLMDAGFFGTGTLPPFISGPQDQTVGGLNGGLPSGSVSSVVVTAGGAGYAAGTTVALTGGVGSGAAATVSSVAGGAITGVTITNGGAGYTVAPTVAFTGGDGAARATVTVSGGAVTAVTVNAAGTGYATGSPLVFTSAAPGVAATPTNPPTIGGGAITGVTIATPGAGYTAAPSVSFAGGGGAGASAIVQQVLYTGFVLSLGGNSCDLVRCRMTADEDVVVRFEQKDANGYYRFRIVERFALRLKRISAVAQLRFMAQ